MPAWHASCFAFRLFMDKQATVLIVDDEPGVRESLRATLAGDCTVYTAATSDDALSVLQSTPVDVVTLDLRMPGIGGMGVLECVKTHDPDIEALIITGYTSDESTQSGLRLGAFAYVSKPFDVTHVRQLVQQAVARRRGVRLLRHAKQQCLQSLGQALQGALHVILGTPTTGSHNNGAGVTDEQRRALDQICSNSSYFLKYLEDLFFLSDLRTGDVPTMQADVPVADVVIDVADAHRPQARAKGVLLTVQGDTQLRTGSDRDLLRRLLDTIVDNAVKFTNSGEIAITLSPAPDGPWVSVVVQDTGVGIRPDQIAALLAPSEPRDLGLGLRIASAIAQRLGARLDIAARRTGGTEVRVALPLALPVAASTRQLTGTRVPL